MRHGIRQTRRDLVFTALNGTFLAIVVALMLYPLLYVVAASISDPNLVNTGQVWLLPKGVTWEGYAKVFADGEIWLGYANTIFYTAAGTLVNLAITLPCAYALARKDLPGRRFFNVLFLFTMFFSGGIIPFFLLVNSLHLLDTVWAVILPTGASIWNIVITRTFIETTIPKGLEEAAEIDGSSTFHKFFAIVLPLSAPVIAVMALFYGVGHWNSYFNEMIFLSNRQLFPLQIFLREKLIIAQVNASGLMNTGDARSIAEQQRVAGIIKYAVMIISSAPVICVYPFLQKFFVKGVIVGSIKG